MEVRVKEAWRRHYYTHWYEARKRTCNYYEVWNFCDSHWTHKFVTHIQRSWRPRTLLYIFFWICVTPWHFFNLNTRNSLSKNLQWHECHLILVFTASLLVIRLAKAIMQLFYSQVLWLIRSKCWHGCATLRRTRSPSNNPVTWLLEYQYHTNYSKFKWKKNTNEQKRRCSNFMFFSFLKGSSLKIAHLWVCNLCSGSFRLFYCLAFPNCKNQRQHWKIPVQTKETWPE